MIFFSDPKHKPTALNLNAPKNQISKTKKVNKSQKPQLGYENQIKSKHSSKAEFTKCKVELIINNKLLGIYSNRGASVENALASNNTFRGIHSNGSDNAFTQMLRHLQHKPQRVIQNLQRGHDRRQTLVEFDIDDDTNDLADLPYRALPDEFIGPNRAKR